MSDGGGGVGVDVTSTETSPNTSGASPYLGAVTGGNFTFAPSAGLDSQAKLLLAGFGLLALLAILRMGGGGRRKKRGRR